jgi:predicted alpha/beta-hydrolase family hydrolase
MRIGHRRPTSSRSRRCAPVMTTCCGEPTGPAAPLTVPGSVSHAVMRTMSAVEIITEAGAAQADLDGDASDARFLLVLTHGAGGSVQAPDVLAARDAGRQLGGLVARITQPYRVRGARAPGSAVRQDAAWLQVVTALRELVPGVPLVQGGRSNGARVVCRTAAAAGARAVIALAFPLHPPQRQAPPVAAPPDTATQVRLAELRAARAGGARVLVVNGERDPFGIPAAQDADRVIVVPRETHSLKGHRTEIVAAITEWLPSVL